MSLGALLESIEKLDDPAGLTRDEMIEAFAGLDRYLAWLASAVNAFDRDEVHALDGAPSMVAWLQQHCRQTRGDAARMVSTARKLRELPHTADAWRTGAVGTGHVRAIVDNVTERHIEKFAATEASFVSDAVTVMQQWRNAADDADPEPDKDEKPDELRVSETLEGRRVLAGHLSADSAAELEQALAHAADGNDRTLSLPQRNARALVELARFFNDHNDKPGSRRNRAHMVIQVTDGPDAAPQGTVVATGKPISRSKLSQLLCDCTVSRMMQARGRVLDYGAAVRDVPPELWQAVAARDQGCRFVCDRPPSRSEVHHVQWAEHGGCTSIENLVMACGYHHHEVHKGTIEIAMDPDGTLHITSADGSTTTTVPPGLRSTLWPPGEPL
jgi:hypothetical protein